MNDLAQRSFNQNDFVEIVEMLDHRLRDTGKNWRHVFKALVVIDYLLHAGSENIVLHYQDNRHSIRVLKTFQYLDDNGRDQGANVRVKARDISNIFEDIPNLQEERRARARGETQLRLISPTHEQPPSPPGGDDTLMRIGPLLSGPKTNTELDWVSSPVGASRGSSVVDLNFDTTPEHQPTNGGSGIVFASSPPRALPITPIPAQSTQMLPLKNDTMTASEPQGRPINQSTHSASTEALIQRMNSLNTAIYDLPTNILGNSDDPTDSDLLTPADLSILLEKFDDPVIKRFIGRVSHCIQSSTDIFDSIIRHLACHHLMRTIFNPFAPGLAAETDEYLKKLHHEMRRHESEAECSRWRSITYHYVTKLEDPPLENAVASLLSEISFTMTALHKGSAIDAMEQGVNMVADLFRSAKDLQNTIKKERLDQDYEIIIAKQGGSFNSTWMDSTYGGRAEPIEVLLVMGFGLTAKTWLPGPGGWELEQTLKKVATICNNFTPRARCPELDNVRIIKQVYGGPYSAVHKGEWKGEAVAIKVINPMDGKSLKGMWRKLTRESQTWWLLQHPRITPLYGLVTSFGEFGGMISPWYQNGNASDYLHRNAELTPENRIQLWSEVAEGVAYLHGCTPIVVHGDLKPANVLIDDQGHARICDFGLVRLVQEFDSTGQTTTSVHMGTIRYLSKELLCDNYEDRIPTTASDIHALACVALEIIFGVLPYHGRRDNYTGLITMDILQGKPPGERPDIESPLLQQAWDALEKCWDLEPYSRPSAGQLRGYLQQMDFAS